MTQRNCMPERNEVIRMLYAAYRERQPPEPDSIKAGFDKLYETMNGMPLEDMDKILSPVCMLCTDHERTAFCDGVRIGFRLAHDLYY